MRELESVIFDWGGTLSKWAEIDLEDVWRLAARHIGPDRERELIERLIDVERECWREVERTQKSATLPEILAIATGALGVDVTEAVLEEAALHHLDAWTQHIEHDPDAAPVLSELRARELSIGLLSNTFWPRAWHERFLERDGLIELIDARTYTSDLPFTKPHPSAFMRALESVGGHAPRALFVGDRPFDDIYGAKSVGMLAVLRPNPRVPDDDRSAPDAVIESLPELLPFVDSVLGG